MAYKKTMRLSSKKKSTRKTRSTATKRKTNKKNSRTHKSKSKKNKKAFRKTKSGTHRNRNQHQGTKKYKGGSDPSRQPLINTNTNLPPPTPLLIDMDEADAHSITEYEVNAMESALDDNSWAEDTVLSLIHI